MKVYRNLEELVRERRSVLAVGTFDGVHRGHQAVIQELTKRARQGRKGSAVVTFEPHPRIVLHPQEDVKLLSSTDEKIRLLEPTGVDRLVIINFTLEFSRTSPEDFIRDILWQRIGFDEIVTGYDHGFGRDRKGGLETLRRLSHEYGYEVHSVEPFLIDGKVVSSTKIRNYLLEGNVKAAEKLLGRRYMLSGIVVRGEGRGKSLHIPTANILPLSERKLVPKDGVYAVLARLRNTTYKGIFNVGWRPTFTPSKWAVEVHLLDFAGELYGERIEVEFVERLRDEQRFESPEALVRQINQDRERSLQILGGIL